MDNSNVCGPVNQKGVNGEDLDEAGVGLKTYLVWGVERMPKVVGCVSLEFRRVIWAGG